MNAEPVRNTISGVESTVSGAATHVTATAVFIQALLIFISQVLIWLGAVPEGIPIELQQSGVALATVGMVWWTTIRSKASIHRQGEELREEVTPWNKEVGAMTPAPTDFVAPPTVQEIVEPDEGPTVG